MGLEAKLSRRDLLKLTGFVSSSAILAILGVKKVTDDEENKIQSAWDLLRESPHELYGHQILQEVENNIWNNQDNLPVAKLLDYFDLRFPTQINWAHNADKVYEIGQALVTSIQMIEIDVFNYFMYKNNVYSHEAAVGHSAFDDSYADLLLKDVLYVINNHTKRGRRKGIKIDLKDPQVVIPTFNAVKEELDEVGLPIVFNADIFGPRGGKNSFTSHISEFLQQCQNIPDAIISLGWQRSSDRKIRMTSKMVTSMLKTVKDLNRPVIFPFHINDIKRSDNWINVQLLLAPNNHFLMIWCDKDEKLSKGDKNWILQNVHADMIAKTFLDVR